MTRPDRACYAQVGLGGIPKIVSLLDRNRLSPTYGCFDRAFWHYKTASFPSGMAQEFVLPLALVYHTTTLFLAERHTFNRRASKSG